MAGLGGDTDPSDPPGTLGDPPGPLGPPRTPAERRQGPARSPGAGIRRFAARWRRAGPGFKPAHCGRSDAKAPPAPRGWDFGGARSRAAMGDPEPPPAPASPPAAVRLWLQRGRVLVWGAAAARALRERYRVSGVLVGAPPRRGRGPRLPLQLLPEEARLLAESGAALLITPPEPGEGPDPELEPSLTEGQDRDPPPHSRSPTAPLGPPQALLVQLPTARGGPLPPAPHPPPDLGRPSPHWPHGGRPGHERRYRVYRDLWGRGLHLTAGGKFGGDFLVYPGPPERFHAAAVALCPPPGAGLPLGGLVAAARLGTHVRKTLLLCAAPPGGAPPAYTSLQWRGDL
ncbi:tRNA-splicing endonuclease subunit Sen34 [Buteo buteo]|uniref:tRNA-splicing endonuclease subunit Sen34 n=1 Tax=Buteo buteo TaxID=30397 RepID=UPI003EBC28FE